MSMRELISLARWDAYRERRHNGRRLLAFRRDAAKAVKGWSWSARTRRDMLVVKLVVNGVERDAKLTAVNASPSGVALAAELLTLEALRDVARATKERLDGNPARS